MDPLKYEDLKVGLHVVCIFKSLRSCYGRTAIIKRVPDLDVKGYAKETIVVDWDDNSTDNLLWGNPNSFALYSLSPDVIAENCFGVKRFHTRGCKISCKDCTRENDAGVKVCWYCGNNPWL